MAQALLMHCRKHCLCTAQAYAPLLSSSQTTESQSSSLYAVACAAPSHPQLITNLTPKSGTKWTTNIRKKALKDKGIERESPQGSQKTQTTAYGVSEVFEPCSNPSIPRWGCAKPPSAVRVRNQARHGGQVPRYRCQVQPRDPCVSCACVIPLAGLAPKQSLPLSLCESLQELLHGGLQEALVEALQGGHQESL